MRRRQSLRPRRSGFRPTTEALENRLVLSAFTWNRNSEGTFAWSDPTNWRDEGGQPGVPGADDTVVADVAANVTILVDVAVELRSAQIRERVHITDGGSLKVTEGKDNLIGPVTLDSGGTIAAQDNETVLLLRGEGVSTYAGLIDAGAGKIVFGGESGRHELNAGVGLAQNGGYELDGADAVRLEVNTPLTLRGSFAVSRGTLALNADVVASLFFVIDGQDTKDAVVGDGDITIPSGSNVIWSGGRVEGAGDIVVQVGGRLNISGQSRSLARNIVNRGTVAVSSFGELDGSGQVLTNEAEGTVTISNPVTLRFDTVENAGLVRQSAPLPSSLAQILGAFNNTGTLQITSGQLLLGSLRQSAGVTEVAADSKLAVATPEQVLIEGGVLRGSGTVQGNVVNRGRVAPGTSFGTLTITGDYTQEAAGVLDIELSDAGRDTLAISGAANLGGTLNVITPQGFLPAIGQSFPILSFASRTGDFASLTGAEIAPDRRLTTNHGPTGTSLLVAAPPSQTLSIADAQVTEGDGEAVEIVFTITLSSASTVPVSFDYTTAPGTATSPDDFEARNGRLTIPAGETTATIRVPVVGDEEPETTETFTVTISNADSATIARGTATGTIHDDDSPGGVVQLSAPLYTVRENGRFLTVTVVRSGGTGEVVVPFTLVPVTNTARVGRDYRLPSQLSVTFAQDETSKTIQIPVINDRVDELNERLRLTLGTPQGANLGAQSVASLAIIDDDPTPRVGFRVSSASGPESRIRPRIDVVLSRVQTEKTVTVVYRVIGGTARNNQSYRLRSGRLVFRPGQRRKSIPLRVINDRVFRGNKTVILRLSTPRNASLLRPRLTYRIIENDPRS